MTRARFAVALVVVVASCGGARFALPMTAMDLVRYDSGAALIAYLGQPDASTSVCDPRTRGPHLVMRSDDMRAAFVAGLVDGSVTPAAWGKCARAALDGLARDDAAALLDAAMRAYGKLVRGSAIQREPAVAERVAAIQRLYLDRRAGIDAHAPVIAAILDELRTLLTKNKLTPIARSFAFEVVATADVAHGIWQFRVVDVALLDELAAAGNEMTLARFAQRLPQQELRVEAMRRLARIHIALSPFEEVREHAHDVEELVVRNGNNRVTLSFNRLVRAWFDTRTAQLRGVLVRQHVWQQTATLLGYAPDRSTLSVLPELSLRGSLWAQLERVSRPVTLCAPRAALDPSPCIDTADVSVANPLVYIDEDGTFHLKEEVAADAIAALAAHDMFEIPVAFGNRPAVALRWALRYERPEPLDFAGQSAGGRGPDVDGRVDRTSANRYAFRINRYAAVVEAEDLAAFHVASRGGRGFTGSTGSTGSTGAAGAQCQSGGPGGPGGRGGDGGPGGDGGNVRVVVACGGGPCAVDVLRQIIVSAGGAGGAGGSGGAGGAGGSGGASRSQQTHTDSNGNTVVDDPGCSAGSQGSQGSRGSDGNGGRPGRPGRVFVDVIP